MHVNVLGTSATDTHLQCCRTQSTHTYGKSKGIEHQFFDFFIHFNW